MKLRLISLFLLLGLSAGALSSCTGNNIDKNTKADLEITLGGTCFKADAVNSTAEDSNIAVYTRDYKDKKGNIQLTIGGSHTDRAVYTIKYSNDVNTKKFTIIDADTSSESKSDTPIPVNGFVVSLPLSKVNGLRIKVTQEITVKGFEAIAPEYERFDLGTFIPENSILSRRVSYINPTSGITEQPCITLITNAYGKDAALPSGAVAFIMRLVASDNYRINSIQDGGMVPAGSNALVFVGNYNQLFAKTFFKQEDKLYISKADKISSFSDTSAVLIGDKIYKVGDAGTNQKLIKESGVYLYNSYFSSLSTPVAELDFYDIAVFDDTVVYKGEKNKRIIIPSNGGVVVSFVGDFTSTAENLKTGDKVSVILMNTKTMPDMYFETNGTVFQINSLNTARTSKNSCVLYSSSYGKNTGTGSNGNEIIISDGHITAIEVGKGSANIPEDGYVLSIQNTNTLCRAAESIETGAEFKLSLADCTYSMTTLKFDALNAIRDTDKLIVYKDRKNTGTNEYGYEFSVDSDGLITGDNSAGNSLVPDGGFVVSGHGKQAKVLQNIYKRGAKVVLDEKNLTFSVIKTPMLSVEYVRNAYEAALKKFNEAKSAFYNIDYTTAGNTIDNISKLKEKVIKAMDDNNYPEVINITADMSDRLDKLQYSMIRSNAVENRAAWYRSSEKSDSEVTDVIKKAASLNINAIYLETWYNGKVIGYSNNQLIKHHDTANGSFDALEAFCRIGHQYGIEIHAWVENFFIGTLSNSQEEDTLVNKTSGKQLLDSQGNNFNRTIYGDYVFLDPYDESNRAFIYGIYKEIIEKYDIDGIHLDYIRFPEPNFQQYDYGYNDDIIKGFQKAYNTSVNPKDIISGTEMYDNWCKFREDIINSWVHEVYNLVRSTKPELWISCACYPDADNVPKTLFQNVRNWVRNGWIDEVFSMSYSTDTAYVKDNAGLFGSIVTDKAFYSTGISAFGNTTKTDLNLQLDAVRDADADGSALFSLGSITDDNYFDAIKNGAYSVKSVQTYKLSKTISAGTEEILNKADNVYGLGENKLYNEKVKPLIEKMKSEANAFDLANASVSQKIDYTQKALKELDKIISTVNSIDTGSDVRIKNALINDFQKLTTYMTKSQNRLKTRIG